MADKRLDNHLCSFAFLTFGLNYGWEKHDRRSETKEEGKRQRKTKGKEEKQNGGEAEQERLQGVRRNSSKEQRYGSHVQLSSLLTFETKRKEKRDHSKRKTAHLLTEERI